MLGRETDYEVSSLGRVRRISAARGTRIGHILTPNKGKRGYWALRIGRKRRVIHRLVAEAFFGISDLPIVRHLNDDPDDNWVGNLAYGTHSDNAFDMHRNGIESGGQRGKAPRTQCNSGHEYTEENTLMYAPPGKKPYRVCRACKTANRVKWDSIRANR